MLTKASWIKICIVALLCIVLCGGMLSCSSGCTPFLSGCAGVSSAFTNALADYENVGNGSVDATQVRNIELDWAAGHVVLETYDVEQEGNESDSEFAESQILLEEDLAGSADDRWKMRWELSEDTLRIAYCASGGGLAGCSSFGWKDKALTIKIPKSHGDSLASVSINGLSGEYELDSLKCGSLNVQLASGRMHGRDGEFRNMRIEMASGNISLAAKVNDELSVETASGEFSLDCIGAIPKETSLEMASGNMNLTVPSDAGLTATVEKTSGSFSCDLPDVHRIDDAYVAGDGSSKMKVKMASGNVILHSSTSY